MAERVQLKREKPALQKSFRRRALRKVPRLAAFCNAGQALTFCHHVGSFSALSCSLQLHSPLDREWVRPRQHRLRISSVECASEHVAPTELWGKRFVFGSAINIALLRSLIESATIVRPSAPEGRMVVETRFPRIARAPEERNGSTFIESEFRPGYRGRACRGSSLPSRNGPRRRGFAGLLVGTPARLE